MAKYEAWENGELPCIESHSQRKHDVVREYLKQYIRVVGGRNFHRRSLTLTLIDGFAVVDSTLLMLDYFISVLL